MSKRNKYISIYTVNVEMQNKILIFFIFNEILKRAIKSR